MKKIGLDVVNLDLIFNVKCDHFSICPSKEVKSKKLAYHFVSFIKNIWPVIACSKLILLQFLFFMNFARKLGLSLAAVTEDQG